MKVLNFLHWFLFERCLNLFDLLCVLTMGTLIVDSLWWLLLYIPLGMFSHGMEIWLKQRNEVQSFFQEEK